MTRRTAATRYAKALVDVATKEHADRAQIDRDLSAFLSLLTTHVTLGKLLQNPAVPAPRKKAAVEQLVALAKPHPIVAKLLVMLADRDRIILLPDLLEAFRQHVMNIERVVRAEVTTATPLSDARIADIRLRLGQATGRTVTLATRVDPAIVGGIVARIGSTVYDASVTNHLKRLKQRLEESI